jgi:hypothetical protein
VIEYCGDTKVQNFSGHTELCDPGAYCDDAATIPCDDDPFKCVRDNLGDGECIPRPTLNCSNTCDR